MRLRRSCLLIVFVAGTFAGLVEGPADASDLYTAARARDAGRVLQLLNSGADPNVRSPYDGPLHVAVRLGPVEVVTGLLEAGADIELAGYAGARPLHAAVLAGQDRIASLLIERGAKVDSTDNVGRSPLLSLVSGEADNLKTLKILLEAGANPNLLDGPVRYHALDYAVKQGRADVAEILLAFGAEVNARDNLNAETPLHHAIANCRGATSGQQDVVKVLIDYGADVNAKDSEGLTPLQYAKRYAPNNGLLHHWLIKAGAK